MLNKIRKSVWETNSSSVHSLTIDENKDGILNNIDIPENGILLIDGSFYDSGNNTEELLYYFSWVLHEYRMDSYLSIFEELVKRHTGAAEIQYNLEEYCYSDCEDKNYIISELVSDQDLFLRAIFGVNSSISEYYNG